MLRIRLFYLMLIVFILPGILEASANNMNEVVPVKSATTKRHLSQNVVGTLIDVAGTVAAKSISGAAHLTGKAVESSISGLSTQGGGAIGAVVRNAFKIGGAVAKAPFTIAFALPSAFARMAGQRASRTAHSTMSGTAAIITAPFRLAANIVKGAGNVALAPIRAVGSNPVATGLALGAVGVAGYAAMKEGQRLAALQAEQKKEGLASTLRKPEVAPTDLPKKENPKEVVEDQEHEEYDPKMPTLPNQPQRRRKRPKSSSSTNKKHTDSHNASNGVRSKSAASISCINLFSIIVGLTAIISLM